MDIGSEVSIHLTGQLIIAVEVSTDISGILKQCLDKTVGARQVPSPISNKCELIRGISLKYLFSKEIAAYISDIFPCMLHNTCFLFVCSRDD